jgi:hypothetical protein
MKRPLSISHQNLIACWKCRSQHCSLDVWILLNKNIPTINLPWHGTWKICNVSLVRLIGKWQSWGLFQRNHLAIQNINDAARAKAHSSFRYSQRIKCPRKTRHINQSHREHYHNFSNQLKLQTFTQQRIYPYLQYI